MKYLTTLSPAPNGIKQIITTSLPMLNKNTNENDKLSHIRRFNHTNLNWNAEIITYTFKIISHGSRYITHIE